MVNMTDIFGNALSIAGSFMDSDLVNRFMMVIFAVILVFGVPVSYTHLTLPTILRV